MFVSSARLTITFPFSSRYRSPNTQDSRGIGPQLFDHISTNTGGFELAGGTLPDAISPPSVNIYRALGDDPSTFIRLLPPGDIPVVMLSILAMILSRSSVDGAIRIFLQPNTDTLTPTLFGSLFTRFLARVFVRFIRSVDSFVIPVTSRTHILLDTSMMISRFSPISSHPRELVKIHILPITQRMRRPI